MKTLISIVFAVLLIILTGSAKESDNEQEIIFYELNPQKQDLQFFWKDENGKVFENIGALYENLKSKGKKLLFAMNGGMYIKDYSPQGLYIENEKILAPLNSVEEGYGNFYMQPNGVFYLSSANQPSICQTKDFKYKKNIKFATQSGPMLVIDGKIHSKFTFGSKNIHIRNGVGMLPNGNLLFAMSKKKSIFMTLLLSLSQKAVKMLYI
jgi:uncharacterized protein YigE (DUF2233 family)